MNSMNNTTAELQTIETHAEAIYEKARRKKSHEDSISDESTRLARMWL